MPSDRAELCRVARSRAKRRRVRRLRLARLLVPLVAIAVAVLYYRPISSYLETRAELSRRQTEVRELRTERMQLEARLARSASVEALGREARRLGYVKPDESLFIVGGISEWRRKRAATVRGDG
jgi:cell division protein FtsB